MSQCVARVTRVEATDEPVRVNPDSMKQDYRYQRSEYAALEVPEYWIVDSLTAKIKVLLLEEGLYEETVFTSAQQIGSPTFPELAITVDRVLSSGNLS